MHLFIIFFFLVWFPDQESSPGRPNPSHWATREPPTPSMHLLSTYSLPISEATGNKVSGCCSQGFTGWGEQPALGMGYDGGSKGGHRASCEPVSGGGVSRGSGNGIQARCARAQGLLGQGRWRSKSQSARLAKLTSWDMCSESHQRLCRGR